MQQPNHGEESMSALECFSSNRSMHSADGIIALQPNRYGEPISIAIA